MTGFSLYSSQNYKDIIKTRVRYLKTRKAGVSLKKLADQIPIQYTYLSKSLNDELTHLNEDHLFRLGSLLDFLPDEVEYLLLLRARNLTTNTQRKDQLECRIGDIQRKRVVRADYDNVGSRD